MRWLVAVLLVITIGLQYRLWFGEGSLEQLSVLEKELNQQKIENKRLEERNRILTVEIKELREGSDSIEEKARTEMGMIKEGETFYLIVEDENGK